MILFNPFCFVTLVFDAILLVLFATSAFILLQQRLFAFASLFFNYNTCYLVITDVFIKQQELSYYNRGGYTTTVVVILQPLWMGIIIVIVIQQHDFPKGP